MTKTGSGRTPKRSASNSSADKIPTRGTSKRRREEDSESEVSDGDEALGIYKPEPARKKARKETFQRAQAFNNAKKEAAKAGSAAPGAGRAVAFGTKPAKKPAPAGKAVPYAFSMGKSSSKKKTASAGKAVPFGMQPKSTSRASTGSSNGGVSTAVPFQGNPASSSSRPAASPVAATKKPAPRTSASPFAGKPSPVTFGRQSDLASSKPAASKPASSSRRHSGGGSYAFSAGSLPTGTARLAPRQQDRNSVSNLIGPSPRRNNRGDDDDEDEDNRIAPPPVPTRTSQIPAAAVAPRRRSSAPDRTPPRNSPTKRHMFQSPVPEPKPLADDALPRARARPLPPQVVFDTDEEEKEDNGDLQGAEPEQDKRTPLSPVEEEVEDVDAEHDDKAAEAERQEMEVAEAPPKPEGGGWGVLVTVLKVLFVSVLAIFTIPAFVELPAKTTCYDDSKGIDASEYEWLASEAENPCVNATKFLPCPEGGLCVKGQFVKCWSKHLEPGNKTCVLTEEAEETRVEMLKLVTQWSIDNLCHPGGVSYVVKDVEADGNHPYFEYTQVVGEADAEFDTDLIDAINLIEPTFELLRVGEFRLLLRLDSSMPLSIPPSCSATKALLRAFRFFGSSIHEIFMKWVVAFVVSVTVFLMKVFWGMLWEAPLYTGLGTIVAGVAGWWWYRRYLIKKRKKQLNDRIGEAKLIVLDSLKKSGSEHRVDIVKEGVTRRMCSRKPERAQFDQKVWPRVVTLIESDMRILVQEHAQGSRVFTTWQWKSH